MKRPSLREIAQAKRDPRNARTEGRGQCVVDCADLATCCTYGCQHLVAQREQRGQLARLASALGQSFGVRQAGQLTIDDVLGA